MGGRGCRVPLQAVCPDAEAASDPWLRHNTGWSNMFAFPWEISAYYDFTTRSAPDISVECCTVC